MNLARRAWHRLVVLTDTRRGAILLFALALGVHAIESIAWPVRLGRDSLSYLRAYSEIFDWHATLPWLMLQRPPVSPLLVGSSLDYLGGYGTELAMAVLYGLSLLAWSVAARTFGAATATATAIALVLYPGYGELFHEVSGDAVFAAAFAGWSLLLVRAAVSPSVRRFAVLGLGVVGLSLVRPGNQALVLVALVPLLLGLPWRRRVGVAAATAAAAMLPLLGVAALNELRYDDFAVARGSNSTLPMFRAFVTDRIVAPDNGPASARLAELVEHDLLPLEPYRSHSVDLDEFFTSGDPRMHEDLVALSDRALGWDTDYALLGEVAREAVRAHPGAYLSGVIADLRDALIQPLYGPSTQPAQVESSPVVVGPADNAGRIPAANQGAYLGTPERRISEIWSSPTVHGPVFRRAGDEARFTAIGEAVARLEGVVPTHRRLTGLARWFDRASRVYPPPLVWLVVGVAALALRPARRQWAATLPAVAALLILGLTALGLPFVPHYGVPVAPAFIVLALSGLLGRK